MIFNTIRNFYIDNNISIIGNSFDYFYNQSLFYDTDYHLNKKGIKINTQKIIKEMKDDTL